LRADFHVPPNKRKPRSALKLILTSLIGKLRQEGLSILLVEQSAHPALKLVDDVHVMSKGQVVYSSRPEELRANDEIRVRFLGI
jgi:ABC-type branched-subunit amino acid transport system ATPase component